MDRGAWWAIVHGGLKELDVTEHTHTHILIEPCEGIIITLTL